MKHLKEDTRCLECSHEFPEGGMTLYEEGWGCPSCGSYNVERILNPPSRPPYSYGRVNVKYEEGEGH